VGRFHGTGRRPSRVLGLGAAQEAEVGAIFHLLPRTEVFFRSSIVFTASWAISAMSVPHRSA